METLSGKNINDLRFNQENFKILADYKIKDGNRSESGQKNIETFTRLKAVQKKQDDFSYTKMLDIAKKVKEKFDKSNVNIQFDVNEELGRIIIKVIDSESGKVVREIPPEMFRKSVEVVNNLKSDVRVEGLGVDVKF